MKQLAHYGSAYRHGAGVGSDCEATRSPVLPVSAGLLG
jgi:hypothetical protein